MREQVDVTSDPQLLAFAGASYESGEEAGELLLLAVKQREVDLRLVPQQLLERRLDELGTAVQVLQLREAIEGLDDVADLLLHEADELFAAQHDFEALPAVKEGDEVREGRVFFPATVQKREGPCEGPRSNSQQVLVEEQLIERRVHQGVGCWAEVRRISENN